MEPTIFPFEGPNNYLSHISACQGSPISAALLPRPGTADFPAATRSGAPHVARHVYGGVRQAQHPPAFAHAQFVGVAAAKESVGDRTRRALCPRVDGGCGNESRVTLHVKRFLSYAYFKISCIIFGSYLLNSIK